MWPDRRPTIMGYYSIILNNGKRWTVGEPPYVNIEEEDGDGNANRQPPPQVSVEAGLCHFDSIEYCYPHAWKKRSSVPSESAWATRHLGIAPPRLRISAIPTISRVALAWKGVMNRLPPHLSLAPS